jgi:HPt (histidine-containing phosphotransfer) domain-containing protein
MEKITNLAFLEKFSGGDKVRIKKYVDMYLKSAVEQITVVEESAAQQNWTQLKTAAHTLKSQVAYMGMTGAQDLLKSLEEHAMNQSELDQVPAKVTQVKSMISQSETELRNFLAEN